MEEDRGYTSATVWPKRRSPMSSGKKDGEPLTVAGIELETVRRGSGRQILTLHGLQTIEPNAPFLEFLARHGEALAPSSPALGHSPRPQDFHNLSDLVHR